MSNENRTFNIGDRVMATGVIDWNDLSGKYGVVIAYHPTGVPNIGVQFDEKINDGHSCDGSGKNGFCWYCDKDNLEIVVDDIEFGDSEQLTSFLSAFCMSEKR